MFLKTTLTLNTVIKTKKKFALYLRYLTKSDCPFLVRMSDSMIFRLEENGILASSSSSHFVLSLSLSLSHSPIHQERRRRKKRNERVSFLYI